MERRYQVFVSSTYQDLKEERQEVMHALLELDCMPSGMELFPAADEDQWSLIKQVIDDCDYYIVIIAGRYGSTGHGGIGYTEMEYRYAIKQGKPVIAFLHKNPESLPTNKSEKTERGRERLEDFRSLAQKKMCKYWEGPAELGSVVSRSLIRLIKTTPAIGWVRSDNLPAEDLVQENIRLRKEVEALEKRLIEVAAKPPESARDLAQGSDALELTTTFTGWRPREKPDRFGLRGRERFTKKLPIKLTWNDIFYALSPHMIDEKDDSSLKKEFDKLVVATAAPKARAFLKGCNDIAATDLDDTAYQTVKIQLRALGLITRSDKKRSIKDTETYWTLTPYGDTLMTQLRAIKKETNNEGGQQ